MLISIIVSFVCPFGCPSFLIEQCGSCWEFLKSLFWGLHKISIDKIKVMLKLDKNNTYFIYRHVYIYILLDSSCVERSLKWGLYRKSEHVFQVIPCFQKLSFWEILQEIHKNTVQRNNCCIKICCGFAVIQLHNICVIMVLSYGHYWFCPYSLHH